MTFLELLDHYNISHQTEGQNTRDGWIQLDCNQCGGSLYLGYNERGRYLNCWKCGPVNLLSWLREETKEPYSICRTLLDGIPKSYEILEKRKRGKLVLPGDISNLSLVHKSYLKKRGFNIENLIQLWRIKGIGLAVKLAWRIFIPVYFKGEVVTWTTRSLVDGGSRYISAKNTEESYPLKELLYGEDYCKNSICCCEGPFDVWKIGPGAVATFGTGYTPAQINRLSKYHKKIICFDNELQAQNRAKKLCRVLSLFPGETLNIILDSKDPGSATEAELEKIRQLLK